MGNYEEIELLGRGSQGDVYTVRHLGEGVTYVMKRIQIAEPEARRMAKAEAEHLKLLQHSAIVAYRECFTFGDTLCIVMEYCEG